MASGPIDTLAMHLIGPCFPLSCMNGVNSNGVAFLLLQSCGLVGVMDGVGIGKEVTKQAWEVRSPLQFP